MNNINEILDYTLVTIGKDPIRVKEVIYVLLIYVFSRLILKIFQRILLNPKREISRDKRANYYNIYQFIRYFVWVITVVAMLNALGISTKYFTTVSAALFVGIGLGMQDLFVNFISGIILMVEGSLKIGDVLEIDKEVVKISDIGLRTSQGINRNNITIIIPNSLITNNKVINWSHQNDATRFTIDVGVGYNSNTDLVIELMNAAAREHPQVDKSRSISTRLTDFGNNALAFQLVFFSEENFRIEKVKSDIRLTINKKFNENNIQIPYPQMDVHMKS